MRGGIGLPQAQDAEELRTRVGELRVRRVGRGALVRGTVTMDTGARADFGSVVLTNTVTGDVAGAASLDARQYAIRALAPDVVDVSSGIESTVGIKDPGRMRAFRDAVRGVEDTR